MLFSTVLITLAGFGPLFFSEPARKYWGVVLTSALITGVIYAGCGYFTLPWILAPFGGGLVTLGVAIPLIVGSIVCGLNQEDSRYRYDGEVIPALIGGVILLSLLGGCSACRAPDYAALAGQIKTRDWTRDTQQLDPQHIRLVPTELAIYRAQQALGNIQGATTIGSQYELAADYTTIQMVAGELWYVIPLDFRDFGSWTGSQGAPGYAQVHAEDVERAVKVVTNQRYRYMPGAYFGDNLERYVWNGNPLRPVSDWTFELDDDNHAWWVATLTEYRVMYSGAVGVGVLLVDPTNGNMQTYPTNRMPNWIDRMAPAGLVEANLDYYGRLRGGWWNSFFSKTDVMESESPTIAYGHDGRFYWVSAMTSTSGADQSMIGVIYTDRTGKSVLYRTAGATMQGIRSAVNNSVAYKRQHATEPILYNIRGHMTALVPILGESHTFQGVAFVDVTNVQRMAIDERPLVALHAYERLLGETSLTANADERDAQERLEEVVRRIGMAVHDGESTYTLVLEGQDPRRIFSGDALTFPDLPLTHDGDRVRLAFRVSEDPVITLSEFRNLTLRPLP
jgi:hypothetical protein